MDRALQGKCFFGYCFNNWKYLSVFGIIWTCESKISALSFMKCKYIDQHSWGKWTSDLRYTVGVAYKPDFKGLVWEMQNIYYYFILITCWNYAILDALG